MGCMKRGCGKLFGIVCLVLGTSGIIVGILFPDQITPIVIKGAVTTSVVYTKIDHEMKNSKYTFFIGGSGEPDVNANIGNPEDGHEYYYIYNVTNPKAFVDGTEKPNVTEVGPFGFATLGRKYNVAFPGDNTVSYKQYSFRIELEPQACKQGQTMSGHPNPQACLDPNEIVTTLNPAFAARLERDTPNSFFAHNTAQVMDKLLSPVFDVVIPLFEQVSMPFMFQSLHVDYSLKIGTIYARQKFDEVQNDIFGGDLDETVKALNDETAIQELSITATYGPYASPIPTMNYYFQIYGMSPSDHAFSDQMMKNLYNTSHPLSFLNPDGFVTWARLSQHPVLIAACESDGTQDCAMRVGGMHYWLRSCAATTTGKELQYNDFVSNAPPESFSCFLLENCGFHIFPHLVYQGEPSPMISQAVYEKLFQTPSVSVPNYITLFSETGIAFWRTTYKYCIDPNLICAEAIMYQNTFVTVMNEFITADEPSATLTDIMSDSSKYANYQAKVCGVANYVRHMVTQPIVEAQSASFLSAGWVNLIGSAETLSEMKSLSDFAYYQFGTGMVSKGLFNTPYFSPSELHVSLGTSFDMSTTKTLVDLAKNPDLLTNVTNRAYTVYNVTDDGRNVEIYARNLTADYTDLVGSELSQILDNSASSGTIATEFIDYLGLYLDALVYKGKRIYCNDPVQCDYRKGGLFITKSAKDYLFTGISDPSLMLRVKKNRNNRFLVGCRNQKYFYQNSAESGLAENATRVFQRSTECQKIPDLECTEGFEVIDTETMASTFFSSNESNASTTEAYYRLAKEFLVDGVQVSPVAPVFASEFGELYRNIEFQKEFDCGAQNCKTVVHTGKSDISKIGVIQSRHGRTESQNWPTPVQYSGHIDLNFNPRFADGLFNDTCSSSVSVFFPQFESAIELANTIRTTLEYSDLGSPSIDVCRYEMNSESYANTIANLNQNPNILPKHMMLSLPPGVNATRPHYQTMAAPSLLWDSLHNQGAELSKFDGLTPDPEAHGTYYDIEQSSGVAVRVVSRLATYFRVSRSPLFPNLKENTYDFPTMYVVTGGAIDKSEYQTVGKSLKAFKRLPNLASALALGIGGFFFLLGLCCCYKSRKNTVSVVKPNTA